MGTCTVEVVTGAMVSASMAGAAPSVLVSTIFEIELLSTMLNLLTQPEQPAIERLGAVGRAEMRRLRAALLPCCSLCGTSTSRDDDAVAAAAEPARATHEMVDLRRDRPHTWRPGPPTTVPQNPVRAFEFGRASESRGDEIRNAIDKLMDESRRGVERISRREELRPR